MATEKFYAVTYRTYSIPQVHLIDRLISMRCPLVRSWPNCFPLRKLLISIECPIRVAKKFTRQKHQASLARTENMLSLGRLRNHSYGPCCDICVATNAGRKRRLIPRAYRDFGGSGHATRIMSPLCFKQWRQSFSPFPPSNLYIPAILNEGTSREELNTVTD